ncbi:MAG TPA: D-alanyl-D-alanine carboxypeptidase [Acetobacteraceae bacterium]
MLAPTQPARAQVGTDRYSSIVVDARAGKVLESDSPDALRHPASLAKLMTLYLTFEALRDRRITLDTLVPVSAHTASMEPTKLGLVPGERLTVEQAILGIVTRSANDAACALGELLGGSEAQFAQMMTLRARALGMTHSTFANASGLPASDEWTSARDMAVLARHLITDFPEDYHYFSTPSFMFRHQVIYNHDTMLKSYPGADGMKTGFTDASGHNLVTSAVRDGVRLIGVVLGANSNVQRNIHMTALLNQGYTEMDVPIGRPAPLLASRLSFIGTAHAETLHRPVPPSERPHPAAPADAEWGIQVGSFGTERQAHAAAVEAHRFAESGEVRVEAAPAKRHTYWRAQLTGLTIAEARSSCSALEHHRMGCFVLRTEPAAINSRVASR